MAAASKPTQDFVPIKEVRDGVVIMKDGSIKRILIVSSLNLALKSPDEQMSIILQFQNFLNSLDFPVQIYIQSRKYDIRPYIALLEESERQQLNDLLRIQTREYINFVKSFNERENIMKKAFYAIVTYNPTFSSQQKPGFFGKASSVQKQKALEDRVRDFETQKSQLNQRAYIVEQGLERCGLRTAYLGTEEIIELFYRMFNPDEQDKPIAIE